MSATPSESEVVARRALRLEVLNDLLTLADAGIELDVAALRELIAEVAAATASVSATPEREQAEALSTALRILGHAETFRRIFLDAVVTPPVMRTDALLVLDAAQTLAAAVSRLDAERDEWQAKAEGVQWGDLSASLTERGRAEDAEAQVAALVERAEKAERERDDETEKALRAAARMAVAVERERELTRALTDLLDTVERGDEHLIRERVTAAREAVTGGVSAAGRGAHRVGTMSASDPRFPPAPTGRAAGRPPEPDPASLSVTQGGIGNTAGFFLPPAPEVLPEYDDDPASISREMCPPEVLPEYDDDPASISREMCPPEVLPEETR